MVTDPTYVKAVIDANPIWKLAFTLSEVDRLLDEYEMTLKEKGGEG